MRLSQDLPYLVFRKSWHNRYTLPVLLGSIEKEGLIGSFSVLTAKTIEEVVQGVGPGKGIICFSFMTPHLGQVKEELRRLKILLGGKAIFIAGGPHATGDPAGTHRLGFDFVFRGEAEQTFPLFLRQYLANQTPSSPVIQAEEPISLEDYPPLSLKYQLFPPMEISRGCLYACTFCQTPRIFGHSLRHRRPQNVADFLRQSLPRGYLQASFRSSNALAYGARSPQNFNQEAIEGLFMACKESGVQGIHFGCYPSEVRPDWVNPEVLGVIKKHCRNKTIVLGAQSGSDLLLARLRRGHTTEQNFLASKWIRQAGFRPHVDFVFGFPEESLEDRRLSLRLMERMIIEHGAKIHAHTYLPLPGTPLFEKKPTSLDDDTKNVLRYWEGKKKLDGWWEEQEVMSRTILEWKDQGWILSSGVF